MGRLTDFLFKGKAKASKPKKYIAPMSGTSAKYQTIQEAEIYELALCRACIHKKADESAKVLPSLTQPHKGIQYMLSVKPNPLQTAYQFYYRLRTIYEIENNAYILPIKDEFGRITGLWPASLSAVEYKEAEGRIFFVTSLWDGQQMTFDLDEVGRLSKMQYKNDFFGDSNDPFKATANLVKAQEQNTVQAIESNAQIRFMAKLNQVVDDDYDMQAQQNLLNKLNLKKNESGVFIYDPRFESMDQINSNPVLLDAEQKKAIDNSVYTYWGMNERILQNTYTEDEWNSFYESELETFFIQLGQVLTQMLYTEDQKKKGHRVLLTSERLQYSSVKTRMQICKEFYDRGMMSVNDCLLLMNQPTLDDPEADMRFRRKEYAEVHQLENEEPENEDGNQNDNPADNEQEPAG